MVRWRVWAATGAALLLCTCTSVDTKFGSFNKPRGEFEPSRVARACSTDSECVEVDYICGACCPGGAALNRKFLDVFKRNLKQACASIPSKPSTKDCTCVMGPVKCLKGLCTWDYQGPDPTAL
jgi:hypothetical protein